MRFQVLHLPAPADEYPFALIIDDVGAAMEQFTHASIDHLTAKIGARAILVFPGPVEVL